MLKAFIAIILSFLLPVMAAQAADTSAKAKEKPEQIRLMLEWFVNPDHGPIIIARQLGYFQEEGVEVTIQEPADPDLSPKMVAAGKAELGIFYQPMLIQAVSDGLPLAWAGTLIASPLDGLIVKADGSIKTLADMKGKTIGFSVSGTEKSTLNALFKPHGFTIDDVKLVNVGWNLSSSLMTGRVDALLGAYRNFELNSLKLHGTKGRMFYMEENGVPSYDELIFIANSKNANKEGIRRFLRAVERGSQYIANHPEKSWDIFRDSNPGTLDNELNRLAWKDTIMHFALRPAAVDKGRYQRYASFMKDSGEIKTVPSVNAMMLDLYN